MSAPEFTAVHPIVFTKTVSGTKVVDQLTNQLTCLHSHPKTHRSSSSHSDWRLYWKSTNTATLVKTNMTYILYVTDRITKTIDIWRQMHTHKTLTFNTTYQKSHNNPQLLQCKTSASPQNTNNKNLKKSNVSCCQPSWFCSVGPRLHPQD